jgi:hypothetical protein
VLERTGLAKVRQSNGNTYELVDSSFSFGGCQPAGGAQSFGGVGTTLLSIHANQYSSRWHLEDNIFINVARMIRNLIIYLRRCRRLEVTLPVKKDARFDSCLSLEGFH